MRPRTESQVLSTTPAREDACRQHFGIGNTMLSNQANNVPKWLRRDPIMWISCAHAIRRLPLVPFPSASSFPHLPDLGKGEHFMNGNTWPMIHGCLSHLALHQISWRCMSRIIYNTMPMLLIRSLFMIR